MAEALNEAHIVYCKSKVLLDRNPYRSWREIQNAYSDYMTSLGPWTLNEIIDFLAQDFGDDDAPWPFRRETIASFFNSDCNLLICYNV